MNLILLEPSQLNGNQRALLSTRQRKHVIETLGAKEGDALSIGLADGPMGTGIITQLSDDQVQLDCFLEAEPPASLPLILLLALPRPKMLRRVLQCATSLGVKEIFLINAWKVEKSYWQSPWLEQDRLRDNCILGLEQAKDTRLPKVSLKKLFKPFVEDELPEIMHGHRALLAHPGGNAPCPINIAESSILAIGPEGGFTPYEAGKLQDAGFEAVNLGERILRVETAVPSIISRLYCP